jgi:hypothetical protein
MLRSIVGRESFISEPKSAGRKSMPTTVRRRRSTATHNVSSPCALTCITPSTYAVRERAS